MIVAYSLWQVIHLKPFYHAAGGFECQRWYFMQAEVRHFIYIIIGLQFPAKRHSAVDDQDIRPARVFAPGNDIQHAGDAHLQSSLFQALTLGSPRRIFICIHEAGREGPQAALGIIDPADEQHLFSLHQNDRHRHLGIGKMDPAAG